tara:strand:+ start:785 stop:1228 length:444 start_codon:yes stop_codon:yes gene_type:complete
MIKALSLAAALALAAPALAVAAPQAAPAAAEAKSPEEIAFEARADAFKARMEQMQSEFGAAIGEAHGDEARGMAAVDAVLARYQPDITSFLNDFDQFIDTQIATNPDETAHQALIAAKAAVRQSLEGLPSQMRTGARTAIAAQTPAA